MNLNIDFFIVSILISIILFAFGVWLYFLIFMVKSIKQSSKLDSKNNNYSNLDNNSFPKVSVIVPARNEEKYIGKCLDSLLLQDYENYEIIAINDCSSDRTSGIMYEYHKSKPELMVVVNVKSKPDEWTGKNWACHQGYLRATGDIFLFTDADTIHSVDTVRLAVKFLLEEKLDALTAIPKIACEDIWSKLTLPVVYSIGYYNDSPSRINDPNKPETGNLFGSFYLLTRSTYEAVGTHKAVKGEILEDNALGGKVKRQNFKLKAVHGENKIQAILSRDFSTLWHGMVRFIISTFHYERKKIFTMTIIALLILLLPFILFPFSFFITLKHTNSNNGQISNLAYLLLIVNSITILTMILSSALHCKLTLFQNQVYVLACPIACTIVCAAFMSSVIRSIRKEGGTINWKGREYTAFKSRSYIV
jgi:chlorobactene glucosyltransferase